MAKIERFQFIDDQGTIHDAVKITPINSIRGSNEKIEGVPTFQLSTGEHLNVNGDVFTGLYPGLLLRRP